MDYMRIETGVISAMISKIIEKKLYKKLGKNVSFNLDELLAKNENGKTKVRVSFEMTCPTEEIPNILKNLGEIK